MIFSGILLVVMLLISGLSMAAQAAISTLSESLLEDDIEKGKKKSIQLNAFKTTKSQELMTLDVVYILSLLVTCYVIFHQFFGVLLKSSQTPIGVLDYAVTIGFVFVTLVIYMVFGWLIPKRLAYKDPLKIAYKLVGMVVFFTALFKPLNWLLISLSSTFGRLFGLKPNEGQKVVTEDEIRSIVEESGKSGSIDEEESEMIQNVFDFSDSTVDEIMTHRTDIAAIDVKATKKEVIEFIQREQYTRFPVYQDSIDHIIGTLHVKDLFKYLYDEGELPISKLIRPPYFIPESKNNSELFKEMQARKNHIAIVLDEYGGTAGLVTIEDLVEEILGNISDEYDTDDYEINEIEPGMFIVDGLMNINDVEDHIEGHLPTDDYDTLSGFILGQLGRFPDENEAISIIYNQYQFRVISMNQHVIHQVEIKRIESNEESDLT